MTRWDGPGLDAWEPWSPEEAAARLAPLRSPWCVVGGWAVDLFLGDVTRHHEDLEVAVLPDAFDDVRALLAGFELYAVGDGEVRHLPPEERRPEDRHQTWVLEPSSQRWRMDVMVEPGDAERWCYRRDPAIDAPRSFMIGGTTAGIPFLLPHGTLLFKAKSMRPKDEADFERSAPLLAPEQRSWLAGMLERLHPGHPWIARL